MDTVQEVLSPGISSGAKYGASPPSAISRPNASYASLATQTSYILRIRNRSGRRAPPEKLAESNSQPKVSNPRALQTTEGHRRRSLVQDAKLLHFVLKLMDNQKVNLEYYTNFYVAFKAIHKETGVNNYRGLGSLTTIASVKLLNQLLVF